jgi:hypothetical protein
MATLHCSNSNKFAIELSNSNGLTKQLRESGADANSQRV